ncbi:UNVERIFIED_CONTAM: hypothetical protein Slati_1450000 [Sesamum latifolium]|uniref:Reverse transcriptase domain-containing protein n=1 Tax=Sesamum latifolium TaxID=2727402 RepID=A0AAW2X7N0_9LAMI
MRWPSAAQIALALMETDLVNMPLTFAAQGSRRRGSSRRGWRMVNQAKSTTRKMEHGLSIIEPGPIAGHISKKIVHLIDEDLDALSAETAKSLTGTVRGSNPLGHGKSGGLLLLWRKDIDVWIQSYSSNHIDALVKGETDADRWRYTRVNGHLEVMSSLGAMGEKRLTRFVQDLTAPATVRGGRISSRRRREVLGNVSQQCKKLDEQICGLKKGEITETSSRQLAKLQSDLDALSTKEEILWKQRAKALWLDKGDQYTAFFHAKANERRVKKEIKTLRDASESGFYGYSVTKAMNEALIQPYVVEQINLALKQIHPLKSSGPDVPLSYLVRQADSIGVIQGVPVPRYAPQVSHVHFADDTLLLYQAMQEAMRHIRQILGTFEEASGLKINLDKSALVFSRNIPAATKEELACILGVEAKDEHGKYLRLHTIVGHSKHEVFKGL